MFLLLLLSLLLLLLVITVITISTELLALCDECLGWGWVWRAELVAGLRVGQAFGVLLLPGFGVSSSSPQVPGHPTSICEAGVNSRKTMYFSEKLQNISEIGLINACVTCGGWVPRNLGAGAADPKPR